MIQITISVARYRWQVSSTKTCNSWMPASALSPSHSLPCLSTTPDRLRVTQHVCQSSLGTKTNILHLLYTCVCDLQA